MSSAIANFKKVSAGDLFVSEPNPSWFGNKANEALSTWTNVNWLKSRFHFSFAEWSAGRGQFGCLRVVNDDLVQPARGFGKHGHGDMEIVTYILQGDLTHKDSMGTSETLSRGSVQFMTAGTGVEHEEHNMNKNMPLRFIQTWILPRRRGLKPNYGSFDAKSIPNLNELRQNKWFHMVGDQGCTNSKIQINQDCNLYVTEVDAGVNLSFTLNNGRQGYLVCVEGTCIVDGKMLVRHEACELTIASEATATAVVIQVQGQAGDEKTHCMLFEMAK